MTHSALDILDAPWRAIPLLVPEGETLATVEAMNDLYLTEDSSHAGPQIQLGRMNLTVTTWKNTVIEKTQKIIERTYRMCLEGTSWVFIHQNDRIIL